MTDEETAADEGAEELKAEVVEALIYALLGAENKADFEARTVKEKPSAEPILQFIAAGAAIFGYDSVPPGDPSRRTYWVASQEEAKEAYPHGWGTAKSRALSKKEV